MATSLAGFLNVPTLAGAPVTSFASAVSEPFPSFELPSQDFSVASVNQKVSEAAQKITSEGVLGSMTNITNGIGFINDGIGGKIPVDTSTGAPAGEAVNQAPRPPSAGASSADASKETKKFKVVIESAPDGKTVVFDSMPTIAESRSTSYEPFSPVHHPGEIMKYKNTTARTWTLSAKLISRNQSEAKKNLDILNTIRAWGMPYYGEGTKGSSGTNLGAPPPILTLSAYGEGAIGPIPCVMESYSTNWPNDIDYISTGPGDKEGPFPVLLQLDISLKESYSPSEYSGFDLIKYRKGDMGGAFNRTSSTQTASKAVYSNEGRNYPAPIGDKAVYSNEGRNYPAPIGVPSTQMPTPAVASAVSGDFSGIIKS